MRRAIGKERRSDWGGLAHVARSWVLAAPDDGEAWYILGVAYGRLGDHEQEIAAYEHAVQVGPWASGAWGNLGAAYFDVRRYGEAAEAFGKAMQLDPNPDHYIGLIKCMVMQGRKNEAAKVIEQLVNLGLRSSFEFSRPATSARVFAFLHSIDPELAKLYSDRLEALAGR